MLEYKGYIAKIDFDSDINCLIGVVVNIKDVITFQGNSAIELKNELKKSVECYLDFCKKRNKDPDRPFSGKLMIRIPPEIHKEIYSTAKSNGLSLNKWIMLTLQNVVHNSENRKHY